MNKNRSTKAQKPVAKKQHKQVNKAAKRTKSTSAKKPVAPLTTPLSFTQQPQQLFSQQKRSFLTTRAKTSFNQLPQLQQPKFQFQPLNLNAFNTPSFTPFNIAKRGLILKPKVPLDKEVDLLFEFNVLKDAKPIVELADSEYPDWLWSVADTQQSLYDIGKIPQDEMNISTMRRKFKLERRDLIRNNNNSSKK